MSEKSNINAQNLGDKAFIFGGAYSNLQATKAILEKATYLGFDKSEIVFTGDMIAYCATPLETVSVIRKSVDHIVMGNCEEAIAQRSNDCGCGFEEGSECSVLSNQWYNFCLSNIDIKTANWMGQLPRDLVLKIGNQNFLVTHATPQSINQFVFPSTVSQQKSIMNVDGYIVGHSGIPFIAEVGGKPWLNSGASGMPANDGTSRVWYSTIKSEGDRVTIENHALEYDFVTAQNAMQSASLKNGYMNCLASGIWPSHDVLPAIEKLHTGIALKPQKKAFRKTPLKSLIPADEKAV